jgi:hypothetical protein
MTEIMAREASTCDLKELVLKFIPESIGKDIEKVRTLPSPPFTSNHPAHSAAIGADHALPSRTAPVSALDTGPSCAGEETFPLSGLHRE